MGQLVSAGAAAAAVTRVAGAASGTGEASSQTAAKPERPGGEHSVLSQDHPFTFIDACMQAWPDAQFEQAHRHGVSAYAVTAWTPNATVDSALKELMFWHLVARQHANLFVIETAEDVRRAKRERRAGLILAAQDGDWIGKELHRVEAFQRLGLRMMLLAYNRGNHIADGALDVNGHGLTRFGRLVVDECNRVGIVLDCSHTAARSTLEIIDRSRHPCVFSHSNPSAIVPNPRNVSDEQIKACAARGGVVCLCTWGPIVMKAGAGRRPTLDDFVGLVDHVAQLTGSADHIGIGTDMSLGTYPEHESDPWGTPDYPNPAAEYGKVVTADIRSPRRYVEGFDDYAQVVDLAGRLQARGYSAADVGKILGGNLLRVFDAVWGPARQP